MISIVNRTAYSSNGDASSTTIPATTAGNTLLIAIMTLHDEVLFSPKLGGVSMNAIEGSTDTEMFYLTNIAGGQTVITFSPDYSPPEAVIYELTPCILDDSSTISGIPPASTESVSLTGSGNDAYFVCISASHTGGSYNSVASPWSLDLAVEWTVGSSAYSAVALLLNATGSQEATFSVTAPSGTSYGANGVSFLDASTTITITPISGSGGGTGATSGFTGSAGSSGNAGVVTETLIDAYPSGVGNQFMRFRLRGFDGSVPQVPAAYTAAVLDTALDGNSISQSLIPNNAITPDTTFYTAETWSNGRITSSQNITISVT